METMNDYLRKAIRILPANTHLINVESGTPITTRYITATELANGINSLLGNVDGSKKLTRLSVLRLARECGYTVHRKESGDIVIVGKSPEEIEELKTDWRNDPCFDIETTEGFEAHHDELLAWRKEYEQEREVIAENRDNARFEKVMLATGISDKDIAISLQTFGEIEHDLHAAQRGEHYDFVAAAQVRATLLQAAQLKRIADVLEEFNEETLITVLNMIFGEEH